MKVLVAGAGPAGAATALLLACSGVGVTLVEREGSFERVCRGEGLMLPSMDALLEMVLGGCFCPYRVARRGHAPPPNARRMRAAGFSGSQDAATLGGS